MALQGSPDLCALPAATPPDGAYNFVNPPTLGPAVIATGVVLCAVSTLFGVGRLYINRNKMYAADYFTLIAVVMNIAFTGIICSQSDLYRHQWDIPVCWYTAATFKLSFVQTVLWAPTFFFSKSAILLLYRQLFAIQRSTRIAINIGTLITFLVYVSNIPLAAVYLAPRVGQSWESLLLTIEVDKGPITTGGVVQSTIGTLIDFYIFFLPMPILARLQIPARRRIQLLTIFSTALLGVGASVVSLVFKIKLLDATDTGWLTAIISLASLIETNIALMVGSMPALPQLTTVTIGDSAFFKSLRSWLVGSHPRWTKSKSSGGVGVDGDQGQTPSLTTFGRNQTPRRNNYYELTDSALLKSQGNTILGSPAED